MTAQNYTGNGFFWTGVDGYRGSYLTTIRNGDYGVYAFGSVNGVLEHSYASGSPDAGFYIGQCYPCNALIDDVVSEWNGLGYSGTNSGGDLIIVNSVFRENKAGHRPQQRQLRGLCPRARDDDRRQPRPRQRQRRDRRHRGGRPRHGQRHPRHRRRRQRDRTQPGRRHPDRRASRWCRSPRTIRSPRSPRSSRPTASRTPWPLRPTEIPDETIYWPVVGQPGRRQRRDRLVTSGTSS